MPDKSDSVTVLEQSRRLAEAIRSAKNAAADRDDVVIEMREAERMRLELLAAELAPVIGEVPENLDLFDFAISSGLQPRLWIDAVAHIGMGRDKRTFRFVKDTRLGRVVLAESTDMKTVANQVTGYLAERIVEQQRMMEGTPAPLRPDRPVETERLHDAREERAVRDEQVAGAAPVSHGMSGPSAMPAISARTPSLTAGNAGALSWRRFWTGVVLVALGVVAGLVAAAILYADSLSLGALWSSLRTMAA